MLGQSREERNARDVAALRAEIDRIGDDIRAVAATLRSLGSRNLAPAATRLRGTAASMAATVAKAAGKKLRRGSLAANPAYAAGAAFCVGALIGFFLRPGPEADAGDE